MRAILARPQYEPIRPRITGLHKEGTRKPTTCFTTSPHLSLDKHTLNSCLMNIAHTGISWVSVKYEGNFHWQRGPLLTFSQLDELHIFQWIVKIFCVESHRVPLKLHTIHLAYTSKAIIFIRRWNFQSSQILDPINGDSLLCANYYSLYCTLIFQNT